MKAFRLLLLVVLAFAVVVAFLVRRRAAETGEDYAAAFESVLADMTRLRTTAGEQLQRAMQDGWLAAARREQEVDEDLAAAGGGAA